MQTVAVDAMGGDRAPSEVVAGALEAAGEDVRVLLVGRPGELEAELAAHAASPHVEIVAASDVIGSSRTSIVGSDSDSAAKRCLATVPVDGAPLTTQK